MYVQPVSALHRSVFWMCPKIAQAREYNPPRDARRDQIKYIPFHLFWKSSRAFLKWPLQVLAAVHQRGGAEETIKDGQLPGTQCQRELEATGAPGRGIKTSSH